MELLFSCFGYAAASLIAAAWEGAILVCFVALLLRAFPGIPAAARSVLWTIVLALLICLHFRPLWSSSSTQAGGTAGSLHLDMRWSFGIVAMWMIISVVRGGQLLMSAVSLQRIAGRATLLDLEPTLCPEGNRIYLSADVERPCVIGFFAPRVLLPASLLDRLSPSDLSQIVVHEQEHLRRADNWTNLLQKISLVLFPLNPALMWVERQLCIERELACDDRVLSTTKGGKAYALCLANLAEHSMLRRGISLALGAWERQSELTRRVHRILFGRRQAMGSMQTKLVTGGLAFGVAASAFALAHSPVLVSFAPSASPVARTETVGQAEAIPRNEIVSVAYHVPPVAKQEPLKLSKAKTPATKSRIKAVHSAGGARKPSMEMAVARWKARDATSWIVLTEWQETATVHGDSAKAMGVRFELPEKEEENACSYRALHEGESCHHDVGRDSALPRESFAVVPAVETISPSYAAVPTPDGWLIFQL